METIKMVKIDTVEESVDNDIKTNLFSNKINVY